MGPGFRYHRRCAPHMGPGLRYHYYWQPYYYVRSVLQRHQRSGLLQSVFVPGIRGKGGAQSGGVHPAGTAARWSLWTRAINFFMPMALEMTRRALP